MWQHRVEEFCIPYLFQLDKMPQNAVWCLLQHMRVCFGGVQEQMKNTCWSETKQTGRGWQGETIDESCGCCCICFPGYGSDEDLFFFSPTTIRLNKWNLRNTSHACLRLWKSLKNLFSEMHRTGWSQTDAKLCHFHPNIVLQGRESHAGWFSVSQLSFAARSQCVVAFKVTESGKWPQEGEVC